MFIEYYTNFLCITAEMTLAGIVDTFRENIIEFTNVFDHHTKRLSSGYVNIQVLQRQFHVEKLEVGV